MGGRAKLRLGRSLPQTRARLRTARHYPQGISLRRLRMPHDRQYVQTTRMNFITGSSVSRAGMISKSLLIVSLGGCKIKHYFGAGREIALGNDNSSRLFRVSPSAG